MIVEIKIPYKTLNQACPVPLKPFNPFSATAAPAIPAIKAWLSLVGIPKYHAAVAQTTIPTIPAQIATSC